MTDSSEDQKVWPDHLQIRDTGLHDDTGGGGQRIYTTAGRGYETREYIRADVPALEHSAPVKSAVMQCYHEGCQYIRLTQENQQLRDRLLRVTDRAAALQRELEKIMVSLGRIQQ